MFEKNISVEVKNIFFENKTTKNITAHGAGHPYNGET